VGETHGHERSRTTAPKGLNKNKMDAERIWESGGGKVVPAVKVQPLQGCPCFIISAVGLHRSTELTSKPTVIQIQLFQSLKQYEYDFNPFRINKILPL